MNIKLLPRVYVAGAYSADNVTKILRNIREGIKLAERVLATKKAAPFAPWLDWMFEIFGDHDVETYYEYSAQYLRSTDIVMVRREGSDNSNGTQKELDLAETLAIPIFYDDEWGAFLNYVEELYIRLNAK